MKYSHIVKLYYYIILVFIIFPSYLFAESKNINTNYELKFKVLGVPVKIGEINSYLTFNVNNYSLNFELYSDKLVKIITSIDGVGKVSGMMNNSILYPKDYQYTYVKKKKTKKTKILFNNSTVIFSETNPNFDKNKLSPLSDEMLIGTIDPITAIIYMSDYNLNNKCTVSYKIYDGKRRYDLSYFDIVHEGDYIICKLIQKKIGGFKLKDKESDIFKPAQKIETYYKNVNNEYILEKIITKNKYSEILINVNYF